MTSIGSTLARTQAIGALLFALVSALVAGAMLEMRSAENRHGRELAQTSSVMEIADLISENRIAEAYLIFDDTAAAHSLVRRRNSELNEELVILAGLAASPADRAAVVGLTASARDYLVRQRAMVSLVEAGRRGEAIEVFEGPLEERFQQIDGAADALQDRFNDEQNVSEVRARNVIDIVSAVVFLFCAFGIFLSFAMYRFVRRRIVLPLGGVTVSLAALADGDVDVAVSGAERSDEIGAMVRALEVFRLQARALDEDHRLTLEAQSTAERLARHDTLTGLPNRRLFIEGLARTVEIPDQPAAVFLIDLDRFKPINDAYGHEAGDEVLCALADRFVAHRDQLGTVARLGGDEFALIIPGLAGKAHAARIANLVNVIVSQPIQLDNATVEVGATIGIALFPHDGSEASTLLRAADLAMYQAKADPAARFHFFKPAMESQVQERALLHADLRRAIAADEIRPHYQPLVSIDDGALVGFEILARWHHPLRGIIMPDAFISVAEELGVLTNLTYRLMREACADASQWPIHLGLSLNLAPSQLRDPALEGQLIAILAEAGISPQRIEIEVTENALITDLEATREVLAALQRRGMSIALDDFGTGYASLNHLRDLKFDKIKIDRSFVSALDDGGKNAEIVRAMISLGKSLGLTTTAEGIEDEQQWSSLAEWGCDLGQGFLFGKGVTARQALAVIARHGGAIVQPDRAGAVAADRRSARGLRKAY